MLSAPELLADHHNFGIFCCGQDALDEWLVRRSRANQIRGASRTYVVCEGQNVIAYYALASGVVTTQNASGKFKRNMPDPIPVALLGRLAVDLKWQEKGLGRALFQDAACRVVQAANLIGIRGILVHAISEEAKKFYLALGFEPSPLEPLTLMVTLGDLQSILG
jgi:predicted N-acetyltransferase YhbS